MSRFVSIITVVICLAVTVSIAVASAPTVQVLTKENVKSYEKGDKAKFLAGKHISDKTADCVGCHTQEGKLDDSNTQVDAQCISCHGSLDDLANASKPNAIDVVNPHESHLGKISCVSCHGGHEPSALYCNNCHTFESKIAFKGEKPLLRMIDVPKYAKSTSKVKEKADVVIIGAGGSGHIAALTARANGAKNVVLLEKMPIVGGNSQLAAGGMNAAGTKYQKEQSIPDTPQSMYEDTMKGGKNLSDPELVKVLSNNSAASMEWLDSIGAKLNAVNMGGGATFKRFHAPTGGIAVGSYLVNIYKGVAEKEKLDVRTNSPVVRIMTDNKGAVTGVLVDGLHTGLYEIEAKSVVLTSGGFSANAERVVSYQPSYKGMSTSNQPGATGDGLDLAKEVNAEFVDMKEIQIHPTVAFGSGTLVTEAVRGVGAILVNQDGKRFYDELSTRDKVSAATLQQKGGYGYLILDDNIRKSLKQIEGYFHLNLAVSAPTLEELAKKIAVPAKELVKTVEEYNKYFEAKEDKAFGRKSMQAKITKGDFVAIKVTPGVHYTMGGVKIDTKAEVIGKNKKPIKNFFAAGEVTGGVHGANRLGGNSISETVTFGRIAGLEATKNAMGKGAK